jgi:hypothetical protein
MGEYWKPVNMTKREYIHPHHMDCGLKLGEWNHESTPVRKLIDSRWAGDDVRAVSDYGGEMQIAGESNGEPYPEYSDLCNECGKFTEVQK